VGKRPTPKRKLKWSLAEASSSAEHAASQLRSVEYQVNGMRERALKTEAGVRVTAEEISESSRR